MSIDDKKITSVGDALTNTLTRFFNKLAELKLIVIAKVTLVFVVVILGILGVNIAINRSANERLIEHILEVKKSGDEKEDLTIRDMVSPKIQKRLNALVYTLDCDRAFVIELHNGKKNATELPFKYFDMTYEEVNENRHIKHVSDHYVNVMTTHYKIPYYLAANTYFYGHVEDLEKIDKRFAANFEEQKGAYIAMMAIRVDGEEIGFIGVVYEEGSVMSDLEKVKKHLIIESRIIRDLLDLSTQKGVIYLQKEGDKK